jgi:hypothetical protein
VTQWLWAAETAIPSNTRDARTMNFETRLEFAETQWHDAQLCRLSYILAGDAA